MQLQVSLLFEYGTEFLLIKGTDFLKDQAAAYFCILYPKQYV